MIALTGGAGAMGRRVVARLVAQGHRVRVVGLPGDPGAATLEALGAQFVGADIRDRSALHRAFGGVDTVIHLAALLIERRNPQLFHEVNTLGTRNALEAAKDQGVCRFVHISSISVTYLRQNDYSRSKREAEILVRRSNLDWTILRPTLAWGDPSAREYSAFARAVMRHRLLPLPGRGKALKSPVHLEDLAEVMPRCIGLASASRRTFDLPGPEKLTLADMAQRIRVAKGIEGTTLWVPTTAGALALRAYAAVCRRLGLEPRADWQTWTGLVEDAVPDATEAHRGLAWSPRPFDPLHDGITKDSWT